jgi:tripartite-type tricarboxylate transporter receptor subunit TctC
MHRYLQQLAAVALCFTALCQGQAALAKDWPAQPIHVVLPYPPGGASDVTARLLSASLNRAWGEPVIVENRPGANGIIANEFVAKAPPDGYTVLMANLGPNAINPAVYTKLPYNTAKDFAPVVLVTKVPLIIVTAVDSPIKDLKQLIAMAKAKPGEITFGSAGNGSGSHLAGELLNTMTGIRMSHIPYKGDSPAIVNVLGQQINIALPTALATMSQVKSGKLRALAITSNKRHPSLPDTPTVDEALGITGFEAVSWGGFMVPRGTPPAIITKMNAEFNKALLVPEVRENLIAQGAEISGGTPEEFNTFLRAELEKWKRVADTAKVKLD